MSELASLPEGPVDRVVFLGTPQVAADVLSALISAGIEIPLVVTRADARRSRGSATTPSPVKAVALDHGLAISHDPRDVVNVDAPLGVVVAYGRIIRSEILAVMPMVNLHLSSLPKWRGAAPVERAVLAGDESTGVCVMQLDEGLDTGPILARATTAITDTDTAADLLGRLGGLGTELLIEQLRHGFDDPHPQTGEASYAAKLEPHDFVIDWSESTAMARRRIRLGRAVTTVEGSRLRVLDAVTGSQPAGADPDSAPGTLIGVEVATADGWLRLIEVQPEGRRAMKATDWRRGSRLPERVRLGAISTG